MTSASVERPCPISRGTRRGAVCCSCSHCERREAGGGRREAGGGRRAAGGERRGGLTRIKRQLEDENMRFMIGAFASLIWATAACGRPANAAQATPNQSSQSTAPVAQPATFVE